MHSIKLKGGPGPEPGFPRMSTPPDQIDALAWYDITQPHNDLSNMTYQARDEVVPLIYPHRSNPNWMGVPRTLAPHGHPHTKDKRAVGAFTFEADFTSTLRPEQVPFVDAVFDTLENELGCIGEAPTGFGKTTVSCWLAAKIGRPICVVIPKGDLDWKPELLKHTNIPENKIDVWQGQRLPDPDAWVTIAMLQSVYRDGAYPQEVYDRFACLIVDEVHRVGSAEFSAVMRKFPAMFRLGLSATADRRDGKMDLVHSHMGWKHVIGFTDAAQPDYFVIPSSWKEPTDKAGKRIPYDPSRTNQAKRSLMADPIRNAQIAGAVYRAHKAGRRTIIFIEQIKHGAKLKDALRAMNIPANMIVEYNGDVSSEDNKRAKECAPGIVLIATYKYTAEGTNIPALDCAVFAHPIYDPRQAKGRITRKLAGKPKPIVLDVWDADCPTLKQIATKRWEFMRKDGAEWKGVFR